MSSQEKAPVSARNDESFKRTAFDRQADFPALAQKPKESFRPPLSAESVLRSFNTRAFKREQPDNPSLMLRIITEALAKHEPISFVLYWGKGPRSGLGEPEFKCLDYLASLVGRIRRAYAPSARVTLIFTDTHAELNGHSQQSISSYFEDLTVSARQRDFDTCLLSKLLQTVEVRPEQDSAQETPPEELFSTLCASAAKWFRGDGTVEQGAIGYYQTNMLEKQVVERVFSRSIFVTFNSSELRSLLPDRLPIFYMYSLRHGVCDKPWFLPSDFILRNAPENVLRVELDHGS